MLILNKDNWEKFLENEEKQKYPGYWDDLVKEAFKNAQQEEEVMSVYGVFKQEMLMPYLTETLIDLYHSKDEANKQVQRLNEDNTEPTLSDGYGPLSGICYFVSEIQIK